MDDREPVEDLVGEAEGYPSAQVEASIFGSEPEPEYCKYSTGHIREEIGFDGRYLDFRPESTKIGQIQSFGCLILVEESSFRILALSRNAVEMLEIDALPGNPNWKGAIGLDARSLFKLTSVATIERACSATDLNIVCPILVSSHRSANPFYAIMRRCEEGLMIDFEPLKFDPPSGPVTGALASHKLAARAVARLKSLPVGDVRLLCNTVVEEIGEMTGYDRIMVYKFHEDEHGEVLAEFLNNQKIESYLGLHYPATDIPMMARRTFMENRVRMIVDSKAPGVDVLQQGALPGGLSLAHSTVRMVRSCHREYMSNMGTLASLVLAITVSTGEAGAAPVAAAGAAPNDVAVAGKAVRAEPGRRLWGLVVCHHCSPCMVPYPTRSACEFLVQVFAVQLTKEMDLANQLKAKHALKMQTLLCDMLMREPPVALVTKTPNISDLVQCDGAALLYNGRCWRLGSTPSEPQVLNIAEWLLTHHSDSTGFSTDSLLNAGYPHAADLGEEVCGLIAVKFSDKDFLMWFRAHAAKEVRWGGEKHDPLDMDDPTRMHPRTSFKAFLETVHMRSQPWEDVEMDAVHSLQLILRSALQEHDEVKRRQLMLARVAELRLQSMDEINQVANETVRIIETATVPILGVNRNGQINGWNMQIAKLTGVPVEEAMGRSFLQELVAEESKADTQRLLVSSLQGREESDVEIRLKVWRNGVPAGVLIMLVNSCANRDIHNQIVGVCLVGQDITTQKIVMDRYIRCEGDYRTIVHSPNPLIPPIFGMDEYGICSEWNTGMSRLTGLGRGDVLGRLLLGEVFGLEMAMLMLRDEDAMTELEIVVNCAMEGHEDTSNHPFSFFARDGKLQEVLLTVSKRTDVDGRITGVFCFLHSMNREVQEALKAQAAAETAAQARIAQSDVARESLRAPLDGLAFIRLSLQRSASLSPDQVQLLETAAALEEQMRTILADMADLNAVEEGYLDVQRVEFSLVSVLNASLSQASGAAIAKGQQLVCSVPSPMRVRVFGDPTRLQQVLATCLRTAVEHTPPTGWIELKLEAPMRGAADVPPPQGHPSAERFRFTVAHSGDGVPGPLVQVLVGRGGVAATGLQGMALRLCRRLVHLLGGELGYAFESGRCCFRLDVQLPVKHKAEATAGSRA
ncbi:hypothetical protein CLOM_g21298 [Closterium sp. NIES-68]|nr:hypothetical protein CLOM_g21298 [Closterium sp. NIES-68]GJP77219.1 hypothetical protein CLOP_g7643 [Closterium sp. NIES-67]GJP82891.1 hypothetical protein CLOP_g13115 [Closterium sp. NIES-67]